MLARRASFEVALDGCAVIVGRSIGPALLQGDGLSQALAKPAPALVGLQLPRDALQVRPLDVLKYLQRQPLRPLAKPPLLTLRLLASPQPVVFQVAERHTARLHPAFHLLELPDPVVAQAQLAL